MKAKTRSILALLVVLTLLWGPLPGCNQPDNPTPVSAPPPPAPKAEEVKVPKQGKSGQEYGAGGRYQKAMNRLNKQGGP
jgi:hypothetical protein